MTREIQLALPWGDDAPLRSLVRRHREDELAEQCRRKDRQIYRLRRTIADRDAAIAELRRDLDERTRERDDAIARLNERRLCAPEPMPEVDPWRFGRRRQGEG